MHLLKKRRYFYLLLLICSCICSRCFVVHAKEDWPKGPEVYGEAAIVMDVNSGTVLYEKNIHEQLYPASITKIMTALLAIENNQLDEKVTFSYDSVHKTEGSSIARDVGEIMTMEECLYGMMLSSANECAYAIAEHTGGTYEKFVEMMNERAKALGCADTHFANSHGLTEEDHYTSCYDMALISKEAIKNELFRQITGTKRYNIPPTNKHPNDITYLTNHQKMLWENETYYYEYCIGGKTGYTQAAGHTLVTFAEKDGMTLVCVVMRNSAAKQYEDSIELLEYCFGHFQSYNVAENLTENMKMQIPESDFLSDAVFVEIDKSAEVTLPKNVSFSQVEIQAVAKPSGKETAGILKFIYAGQVVGTADIEIIKEDVKEYPFTKPDSTENLDSAGEDLPNRIIRIDINLLLWIIVLIILGVLGVVVLRFIIKKHRQQATMIKRKKRRRR